MTENDGGPAYPVLNHETTATFTGADGTKRDVPVMASSLGLTIRDWFAGQALANTKVCDADTATGVFSDNARYAYLMADAMIAERAKGPTS